MAAQHRGRWQVNTVTLWRSGTPFNVTCGNCDFNQDGIEGDRVNTPSFGTDLGSVSDDEWLAGAFTASDFPRPAVGTLGTLPRNAYYGPGYFTTDLSLFKNITIPVGGRQTTFQIRVEAYNVFNTLNLANPERRMWRTRTSGG